MTRGIDCFNPMNIMMVDTIHWQGQINPTRDPNHRLCTFDSMMSGLRAGAKTLLTYYNTHGLNTVNQIINRFAPSSENNTSAYVNDVCDHMGVQPDEAIDVTDPQTLEDLVISIIHHEQGVDCCTLDQIKQGVESALAP